MEYIQRGHKMHLFCVQFAIMLLVSTTPLHSAGFHLNGRFHRRSTEAQTNFTPSDDSVLKQDEIKTEIPNDDTVGIGHIQPDDRFSLYLPPWLSYFRDIWQRILIDQNNIKRIIPSEFENAIETKDDIPFDGQDTYSDTSDGQWEQNGNGEIEIGEMSSSGQVSTDDTMDSLNTAEAQEPSELTDYPENAFENFDNVPSESEADDAAVSAELDSGSIEPTEEVEQIEVSDSLPEVEVPSEPSETEISIEQELQTGNAGSWDQGNVLRNFGFTGNLMQGMLNTAMQVIPRIDHFNHQTHTGDIPDALLSDDHNNHVPQQFGFSNDVDNSDNTGSNFMSPFGAGATTFANTASNINTQFDTAGRDNEQDSSS